LVLQAVVELVRRRLAGQGDISDLLADLKEAAEGGEVRIRIMDADFKPIGAKASDGDGRGGANKERS